MNRRKTIVLVVALALIAVTGGLLAQLRSHQSLGPPGVKTSPVPGSPVKLNVDLPPKVLDCKSEVVDTDKMVLAVLPADTSFGQRRYLAPDGFSAVINVVLMGTDRTSMHKPELCLGGAGFRIDQQATREERVPIPLPRPYELPVRKTVTTKQLEVDGRRVNVRGIYAYWFVTEDRFTARHWQRMWWMAEHMVKTGVLQRWAYVSCFTACLPGQEDQTFERMKTFLAAAVPQFQLYPRPESQVAVRP